VARGVNALENEEVSAEASEFDHGQGIAPENNRRISIRGAEQPRLLSSFSGVSLYQPSFEEMTKASVQHHR
jgi:hypothetical protein